MATIALYANKINSMPGLVKDIRNSVNDLKSEFMTLKNKSQSINRNICNLDDVISSISASTQIQEDKMDALNNLAENVKEFASDVEKIDSNVATMINKSKDDFYDKYDYLKPKSVLEMIWDSCKSGLKSAAEWCKEHWVMIVTVLVVIAVAVIAVVTFGVAIPAIAAIAGIVSLAVSIADVICMIVTGGKSISDLCRENGMDWLGEIFDGLSLGCDIVSIAFPAVAAIKTMAKVGVKAFVKGSIQGAKETFKQMFEQVFKSGFKNGVKNFAKIVFKTFVFDIDDISRVNGSGKRVFDIFEHKIAIDIPKNIEINYGGLNPDGSVKKDPLTGKRIYPENDGFIGEPSNRTLNPGAKIDRYGKFGGIYVSPEGTPFKNRALPVEDKNRAYNSFEVNVALDVKSGKIASFYGQPGGGEQFILNTPINILFKEGKLKLIDYPQITLKGLIQLGGRETLKSTVDNAT